VNGCDCESEGMKGTAEWNPLQGYLDAWKHAQINETDMALRRAERP